MVLVPSSKRTVAVFVKVMVMLQFSIVGAIIHPPPTKPSSCQADLSSCRAFVARSTKYPSVMCCRQFKLAVRCPCRSLTGGPSVTLVKDEALSISHACKLETPDALVRCFNGSGMTNSSMKSPKGISASSNHSLHADSLCPGCGEGSIDPGSLIPRPPNSP